MTKNKTINYILVVIEYVKVKCMKTMKVQWYIHGKLK